MTRTGYSLWHVVQVRTTLVELPASHFCQVILVLRARLWYMSCSLREDVITRDAGISGYESAVGFKWVRMRAFVKKILALQDKNRNACRKTWQLWNMYEECGARWRSWLRHCPTNRKVVGLIPHGVNDLILPSALESTQLLTKIIIRNISCGIKVVGA